jgi:hypothetical protein
MQHFRDDGKQQGTPFISCILFRSEAFLMAESKTAGDYLVGRVCHVSLEA